MSSIVLSEAGAIERPATAAEIRTQVNLIQEVMQAVMRNGHHYGVIPGAGDKPTLFKPGAEKLFLTFRIAVSQQVEDLSNHDAVRFRVRAVGTNMATGLPLGDATGECSSDEEKYRWRRAVCDEEFDATPEDRRRVKYGKAKGSVYTVKQVRTHPADVANTVLKMAAKRAEVALALRVTAASDIFTQDIEDLPEELRETVAVDDRPPIQQPQRKAPEPAPAPSPAPVKVEVMPPEDSGTQTTTAMVSRIETKEGVSKTGKPWKLYRIHCDTGETFSTFDEDIAEAARLASTGLFPVVIAWSNDGKGKKALSVSDVPRS